MKKMVGDQTANQATKPLKKEKKNHQFWKGRIAVVVLIYYFIMQTCLCVSLRQVWSPPVEGDRWVGSHWPLVSGLWK
jgi:hypothetical protein